MNYIGEKLEAVLAKLNKLGITYNIIDNNFSVDGDTALVTNYVVKNNIAYITVGSFVFDVKNKKNN